MHHAILAPSIAGHAVYHSIFGRIDVFQHLLVTRVMAVGHQVTRRLPTFDVAGGNGPGGAGEFAFPSQKLLVHRRAENGEALSPLLNLGELLPRHLAGEKEILGLAIEPLDHVLFGGVILVARRDSVAIDLERGEVFEHLLDFLDIGFLVNGGVGGHLVAENFRHPDRLDAFLENALALDDQIVGIFQAVDMHVPIHPLGGFDGRTLIRFTLSDGLSILGSDQVLSEQGGEFRFQFRAVNGGQVIPHFFPHEHAVRADINDAALLEQTRHQLLNLGIDQRLAAADRHHRRLAFLGCIKAILQAHHVLQAGGVFPNAPAARAGQVTGVQRFELEHHGEPGGAPHFVFDDMPGDFRRQRQWKSHTLLIAFPTVSGLGLCL